MVELATLIFGHLAAPECRRAVARGWLIAVRGLTGISLASIALFFVWYWWVNVGLDPFFVPSGDLHFTLAAAAMIMLTIDVVMIPAVLAGSLAGERTRGVLHLLLSTAASPREIVLGRLIGKLSQVGAILLAGVPTVVLLGVWDGFGVLQIASFVLLLAAVGLGGGGLAMVASVISRRGRDALLGVYLIILVLYLSPLLWRLGLPQGFAAWLAAINPYMSLTLLIESGRVAPSLVASAFWLSIGFIGPAIAAWRLRPSCLASGEIIKRGRRGRRVPPLDERRPMLWKELYIERVGTLGRFGRFLGVLLVLGIGGGSLAFVVLIAWSLFVRADVSWSDSLTSQLGSLLEDSGLLLGWLLQWAIGIRAAVSIASERERGTWDALLVTSLEPGEIVVGKVSGSLNALCWIAGAMVVAWTFGVATTAVTPGSYAKWIVGNLTAGSLMAAVGVRSSLATSTATRAMSWTIAWWLILLAGVAFLALSIISGVCLACVALWLYAVNNGLLPFNSVPWFPMSWEVAWPLTTNAVTVLLTVLLVLETRLRFDRLAGRITGGAIEVGVDKWLYGHGLEPVFIPSRRETGTRKPTPPPEAVEVAVSPGSPAAMEADWA